MATCNVQTLIDDAACFDCLSPGLKETVKLQLLCEIMNGGGGGGGGGTVTSVSVTTANGVSGSVLNPSTTPAISLTLGAITPTTVNKVTLTTPATGSTLTIDDGKTFRASASLTLAGTDSTTMTFPGTSATIARIDAAQSFAGIQTFSNRIINSVNGALSAPAVSITGTPITGGSSTTTKPLVLVETTGATSASWTTAGAMVGVNAITGFTGNLADFQINGSFRALIDATGNIKASNSVRGSGNSSTFILGSSDDTILSRKAAANWQLGSFDAAAPVAQTLSVQSVVAGTTDTAGADWTFNGSRGTGTAKSGNLVRKTGNTTTTGSAQHTLSTREILAAKFVDLTETTATTLFTITVGTENYVGIIVDCTVFASDATDHQSLHSVVNIAAVNKAGTITATVTQVDGIVASSSVATLTPVTYTVTDNGSGVLALKVSATSSLIQTTLRAKWQARINSNDAATVTAS